MDIPITIKQLENGELTPEMLFPKELFFVIAHYWKNGDVVLAKKLSDIARKRLEDKGLKYIDGEGWK